MKVRRRIIDAKTQKTIAYFVFDQRPIYVYSWDPRAKKVHEYIGYYGGSAYGDCAFLLKEAGKHTTWFRKIPEKCGEFYNNAVWFTEPNPKKALLVFIEAEIEKLKECERVIEKAKENIEYLSKYDYEE